MVAKQKWSPNKNPRQTNMVAKQKWPPNKNGRQTKMVAKPKTTKEPSYTAQARGGVIWKLLRNQSLKI